MKSKKRTTKAPATAPAGHPRTPDASQPAREHFRREKAARADRTALDSHAMAAARREYVALLEANAAKGRGGRPRKKIAAPKSAASDHAEDELEESPDE